MQENFFTKDNYDEDDIKSIISNGLEESVSLEFKRNDAIKNNKEIAKDVCAFANSGGGIIIYGIEEEDHKAKKLSFINGNLCSKETLDQIITTRITRRIPNLKIYPIRFEGKIEQTVYLVKIPESQLAPHMTGNKYYKRYNFTTLQMEEYEVRNAYFKHNLPVLEIVKGGAIPAGNNHGKTTFFTNFVISNTGNILERFFKLEITIPAEIYTKYAIVGSYRESTENPLNKFERHRTPKEIIFSIPSTEPIFPNELMKVGELYFEVENPKSQNILDVYQDSPVIDLKLYYTGGVLEEKITLFELIMKGQLIKYVNEMKDGNEV